MTTQRINYDISGTKGIIAPDEIAAFAPALMQAEEMLANKNGLGNDYLGWLDLPDSIDDATFKAIETVAADVQKKCSVLICIGIGGSYLGSKAAIEFLSPTFEAQRKVQIIFAGHQINSDYMADLLAYINDKDVCLNVISKSGTTTEPGVAFRILRQWLDKKYGAQEAAQRIIATTDPKKGALRTLATQQGYTTFPIPADVGGRFSVLTAVGLLPIAVAGIDIRKLVQGAREARAFCSGPASTNPAALYAATRSILFRRGKAIEVMGTFAPQLSFICEWWKQLSGESEGKNNTGLFPASLNYTTDLHSLGQWMQEGVRNVFETFLVLKQTKSTVTIPRFDFDGDELNYLADRSLEQINDQAFRGTFLAHIDGGVPCGILTLDGRDELSLGQAFYFFEKSIALTGYLLRVNPFDQPGVEAYKKNMFALLGKPGFEKQGAELKGRLKGLGL